MTGPGRPPRGTHEVAMLRQQRQAAYDAVGSVRAYAQQLGVAYSTAHYLLASVGVRLNRRGRPAAPPSTRKEPPA